MIVVYGNNDCNNTRMYVSYKLRLIIVAAIKNTPGVVTLR